MEEIGFTRKRVSHTLLSEWFCEINYETHVLADEISEGVFEVWIDKGTWDMVLLFTTADKQRINNLVKILKNETIHTS